MLARALIVLSVIGCLGMFTQAAETPTPNAGEQSGAPSAAGQPPPPPSSGGTADRLSAPQNPTELISHVNRVSRKLSDLERQIEGLDDISAHQRELKRLSERLEDLSWDIFLLQSSGHHSYDKLTYYKSKVDRLGQEIENIKEPLDSAIQVAASWRSQWVAEQEQSAQWRTRVEEETSAESVAKAVETYSAAVGQALGRIDGSLTPLLDAAQTAGDLSARVAALGLKIDKQIAALRRAGFQKTNASLVSRDFYAQFDSQTWRSLWQGVREVARLRVAFADVGGWSILPIFAAFAVIALLVKRSECTISENDQWCPFARRPLATAILICTPLLGILLVNLPPAWLTILQLIILVAVLRLVTTLLPEGWIRQVLGKVALLLLVLGFCSLIALPLPLFRLVVFLIASAGIVLCVRQALHAARGGEAWWSIWIFRLGGVIFFVIAAAEILGYSAFATYLLRGVLRTVLNGVVAWMLFRAISGILELALGSLPVPLIQRNADHLIRGLRPLLIFIIVFGLAAATLVNWRVYATEPEALRELLTLGVDLASQRVTLGLVLSAGALFYAALISSRIIQKVLAEEVLRRRNIEQGVRFSISRLVHYAIVTLGFLIALRALGFSLTNLTILGSALGVGIGFGLQAIVNNFASGLILLFERPVKVGDTVQIGDQMGEVRDLGLRATVIKTYDSAEIVVPNSDLVTGQVTNWTLAERRIRLKLPVGVAYGSDVERVMTLLMECAAENSKVLKVPAPRVLFLAFGASSLDFELRVWIAEFTDRRIVQSDINRAMEKKLREAGIEIPFPQQDIYLRGLPEALSAKTDSPEEQS